jgi:hypothetical protein
MQSAVEQFVRNCHTCSRIKTSQFKYQGSLKPLPVPERAWQDLSIDFIGPLLLSLDYDAIMVVTC